MFDPCAGAVIGSAATVAKSPRKETEFRADCPHAESAPSFGCSPGCRISGSGLPGGCSAGDLIAASKSLVSPTKVHSIHSLLQYRNKISSRMKIALPESLMRVDKNVCWSQLLYILLICLSNGWTILRGGCAVAADGWLAGGRRTDTRQI